MSAGGTARGVLRSGVELLATGSGLAALARRVRSGTVAVLAYHNIVLPGDEGRGDASLHTSLPTFLRQIDRLSRTHEIVDLETATPGRHPKPRAVITFDDAYRGAVNLAIPELARRGIPATVFVAPGLLGAPGTWWDQLAEAGRLSPETRERALLEWGGRHGTVQRQILGAAPLPDLPASYGIATAGELEESCGDGIRLGSHAWAHEHLPDLSEPELEASLLETLDWLDRYPGPTTGWLALPYGAGSARVERTALRIGHSGVLRIRGGVWTGREDRGRVPRINVPAAMSVRGLELRASGLREVLG